MIDNQKNLQPVESDGVQPLVVPGTKTDSGITGAMGALPTSNIVEQEASVTVPSTEGPRIQDTQGRRGPDGPLGLNNYYAETAPLTSTWENKAEEQSAIQFQQNVLQGKQTSFQGRKELEAQGQEMQTQLALGQYMRGQSAEKAGWTGGYMLDQKRQGDYLKASIQAQMYGAQELQRYGMETQLEAARLAYDLGKEQLAYQLYQQEYQKSITEAQMFGYYVSPENRDLLNQLRAAQGVLLDANATADEKTRATAVKDQIDTWFGEQNLDPNDISKFAEITMEREQWNQAKLDAVLATINDDPSTFIARKSDGTYETDPATGQYLKLNFDDISSTDLGIFLSRDDASTGNKFADATFRSYARFLAQSTINDYFISLGENGVPTADGFKTFLSGPGADKLQAFRDKNSELKSTIDAILASNFSPSLTRNGVTISYGQQTVSGGTQTTQPTTGPTIPQQSIPEISTTDGRFNYSRAANPFSYTMNFVDYTKEVNSKAIGSDAFNQYVQPNAGDLNWAMNANFKMAITNQDGSKQNLEFELGNHIGPYFGIVGIGVDVYNKIDYTIPTSLDGSKTTTLTHNELLSRVRPGEIQPVNMKGYGADRHYLVININNILRIVEAAAGRGKDHVAFLKKMGYTDQYINKFQFINA
jgi:hypothetical protein